MTPSDVVLPAVVLPDGAVRPDTVINSDSMRRGTMRPERMCSLSLVCRRDDVDRVINILADAKAVHIVDHETELVGDAVVGQGMQRDDASMLSATLVKGHNLAAKLCSFDTDRNRLGAPHRVDSGHTDQWHTSQTLKQRMAQIDSIASDFAELEDRIHLVDNELESDASLKKDLLVLEGLDAPLDTLFGSQRFKAIVFDKNVMNATFAEQLSSFSISTSELDRSIVVMVEKDKVAGIKSRYGHKILDVSRLSGMKGTAEEKLRDIEERRKSLAEQRYKLLVSQASFAKQLPQIRKTNELLSLELMKAQAPSRFGVTARLAIIRGFISKRRTNDVKRSLEERSVLHIVDFADVEDAPIQLDNPMHASDFEMLIRMYSLPRYDEIDPTMMMAFTFPIFFGFMLGDIGYGIVALILFLLIGRRFAKMKPFCNIMMLSAISAMAFGFLFGEFFGATSVFGVALPSMIHRETNIMTMLGIAIVIGILHINLGLLIGMVNESRDGWLRAVVKKGGFMLLQAGAFMLLSAYGALDGLPILGGIMDGMRADAVASWAVLAIAIIAIIYSERMRGVLELPLVFSNMLSYTRLVALGLSSVFLAVVVNEMAFGMFGKGGLWIVPAVLVLIVGHTINLMLGLLGPFLHSLRLHYVEFFNKFYEGGGKPFVPFGEVVDGA